MNRSVLCLNDFFDEILLMIFEKLANVDVLYSLYCVNKRFTRIVRDQIFVKDLLFVRQFGKVLSRYIHSDEMLTRLCDEVLPMIADDIERFDLETSFIKEIFNAGHYRNLSYLAFYKLMKDSIEYLFSGKTFFSSLI